MRFSALYFCLTYNGRYNPDKILGWSILSPFPKNMFYSNWFASGQESLYRGWAQTVSQRPGHSGAQISGLISCLDECDPETETGPTLYLFTRVNAVQSSITHNRPLGWLVIVVSWADKTFLTRPLRPREGDSEQWSLVTCIRPLSWPGLPPPTGTAPAPGPHVTCLLTFPHFCILSPGLPDALSNLKTASFPPRQFLHLMTHDCANNTRAHSTHDGYGPAMCAWEDCLTAQGVDGSMRSRLSIVKVVQICIMHPRPRHTAARLTSWGTGQEDPGQNQDQQRRMQR